MHRDPIERPTKERCAIYARVSSHRQKNDGDLDRQLETLTKVCRRRFKSSPLVFTEGEEEKEKKKNWSLI